MTPRARQMLVLIAGAGLLAILVWGWLGLPGCGRYPGPYGDVLNASSVAERHATDVVTAINFDYRGFDTLGEESILFASVLGTVLLLRRQKDESAGPARQAAFGRSAPAMSDAVRAWGLALTGPLVVFGWYIVAHGQVSPGGGFQGGAILASVPLMLYLCGGYEAFRRITSHDLAEAAEAVAIAGFGLMGMLPLLWGQGFLQNWLPLGTPGDVASGGSILVISLLTGLEVAAGFVLLLIVYFDRVLMIEESQP